MKILIPDALAPVRVPGVGLGGVVLFSFFCLFGARLLCRLVVMAIVIAWVLALVALNPALEGIVLEVYPPCTIRYCDVH